MRWPESGTISRKRSKSAADSEYAVWWTSLKHRIRTHESELELKEADSFFSGGDSSHFGHVLSQKEITGHVLLVQKGSSIYVFTIFGFTIETPNPWHELFDPRIEDL